MQKIRIILNNIKKNQRYIWVFLVLLAVFMLNQGPDAKLITAGDCLDGNCAIKAVDPSLSDENPIYYVDEIFKSKDVKREYYRLVFDAASDRDSEIEIFASDFFDNESPLKKVELKKNANADFKEIFFSVQGKYSNLTFKKNNEKDGASIFISNVGVSKLDVKTEEEFARLIPTKRSAAGLYDLTQSQYTNDDEFSQLCEDNIIFGQIFKAPSDYITAVALDMNIVKQGTGSGRKYGLELRDANYDEADAKIKSDALADVDFTLEDVEKYRREDGKFQFPIFSPLKKGQYYFIGINNDRAVVDKLNCLKLKGSFTDDAYSDGRSVVKTRGETYTAPGDLYFALYGPQLEEYDDKKLLFGSIIEGVGKNLGNFKYQVRNSVSNIIDLDSYSPDIDLESGGLIMFGSTDAIDSNFIYKFETIYPLNEFTVSGEYPNSNWHKASIFYSYDNTNWKEIPESEDDTQDFSYTIIEKYSKETVFIKVVPKNEIEEGKKSKYGIKNFKFEAKLPIK